MSDITSEASISDQHADHNDVWSIDNSRSPGKQSCMACILQLLEDDGKHIKHVQIFFIIQKIEK